jgi:hypothetical protein
LHVASHKKPRKDECGMPDIRYFLKDRDPTSTGGMLIAVSRSFTHHGVMVGLEGDIATCPACKSSGPVYNDCFPT